MIGYKNIPVTGMTQKGPMSVIVGLTYIRDNDTIEVWDSWINPAIKGTLDLVDQTVFIAKASTKLVRNLAPIEDHHNWEEVLYG